MGLTDVASSGANARCAIGKQVDFLTAIVVTDVFTFLNENLNPNTRFLKSEYLAGNVGVEDIIASVQEAGGTLPFTPVFDTIAGDPFGWEMVLLASMGANNYDGVNSLTQFTLTDALDQYLTVAIDKTISIWELQGAKVKSLKLAGKIGEALNGEVEFIGRRLVKTGQAGIVNTLTTVVTNLVPTAKPQLMDLKNAVFSIGIHGGALGASDAYGISEFELMQNNGLSDAEFSTTEATGHTDSTYNLEPVRNAERAVTFGFKIIRYTADQLFTWAQAGTPLQAMLKFTLGTNQFNLYMPNCKFEEEPKAPIAGRTSTVLDAKVTVLVNGSVNTNMAFTDATAITNEFGIEVKSARTVAV